jgi:excinuclease ABC subunit C
VEGLFSGPVVVNFGPNALEPAADAPGLHRISAVRSRGLRGRVREECPRVPGVYGMLTAKGELIYIGKAKCLRSRLLSYFRTRSRDPKAGHILKHASSIVWEHAPNEFAALLRELELIRRWRPRFNVQGQPQRRRRAYVCLGRKPAPHLFLAPHPVAGAVAVFGPVPAGRRTCEAVRHLNDWFGLRDCPKSQTMIFAEQSELFPISRTAGCLRYELGTCLGPCIAACTSQDYMQRVRATRAFLAGTELNLLDDLKRAMLEASRSMSFERAAALRDKLERLTWLHERLDHLCRVRRQQSFVYPVPGSGGADRWYLIHGGRVVGAIATPRSLEQRRQAAELLREVYQRKVAATAPVPCNEVDGVFLVASWFRRHPDERGKTLRPARAFAACRTIREVERA